MRYLHVSTFAGSVLALYLVTGLATDYATIGHGLHPALAMVAGCVLTIIGAASLRLAVRN